MSNQMEELMPAEDAARDLGVSPGRLVEYATQGELRAATMWGPEGLKVLYYRGEVLRLRERLGRRAAAAGAAE